MIKTFRGQLADGGQDTISLHTNDGKTGYRVVKFEVIGPEPGQLNTEHTVKIYKTQQTTVDNTVNFTDGDLLGAAYYQDGGGSQNLSSLDIIFDSEIFNQDIFVTAVDTTGSESINYYIELEQMSLDMNEATVATLQFLRSR